MTHTPSSPARVLVLDGDMTPALTVVRSLAQAGRQVDVASAELNPIAGYSRHARQRLHYPDPLRQATEFIDWLRAVQSQHAYQLIVPVTERSVMPMFEHRAQLTDLPLALPDNASLGVALDKHQTLALARKLDIPAPHSLTLSGLDSLDDAATALSYPIVVKPARSMGSNSQGHIQLSVSYALNAAELRAQTIHALQFGAVILQEYFAGQGVGIELIAEHGEIRYAFQHLRLHEVPLSGGGSSLRESVTLNPVLLDASQRLMAALHWHGVAMVEFKWSPATQTYRLMEINGRFWGSLPLAVAAGADFPAMLAELLIDGMVQPCPPARLGIVCRKLSRDLAWHEQVLRQAHDGLAPPPPRSAIGTSLRRLFSLKHRFDVQSLSDPLPGLIDISQIAQSYANRVWSLWQDRRLRHRQRAAWSNGRVTQAIARAQCILFVCYGNINRSALAERVLRQQIAASPLDIVSAGFHEAAGRPADPIMVAVARDHGIDLSDSQSRQLDAALLTRADIVFVMELAHLRQIQSRYPEAAHKTYLLGMADPARLPDGEIADPYGRLPAYYAQCFEHISACIAPLARACSGYSLH